MEKYYVIEISEGDEKIKGKSIYEYDKKIDAMANFHSKLGAAMKSDLYTSEQIIVVDSNNDIIRVEKFTREVQKVEIPHVENTQVEVQEESVESFETETVTEQNNV